MSWSHSCLRVARPGAAMLVCLVAILVVTVARAEPPLKGRPNIVFILADDQGWNGTSVQMQPDRADSKSDYYRTPNIERLAAAGLRFSQAYSPGPMCSPTRASLQTGKTPARLHMTNVGRSRGASPSQQLILPPHTSTLSTDEVTIGEMLQRSGYATAWFGKWHLGGNQGPGAHGYDRHDGPTGNNDGNTRDPDNPKDIFGITERGVAFMRDSVKRDKPFYLQLWHYAVHGPIQSRRATAAAAADRPAGKTHGSASFAAMTEDLDTAVGTILDELKKLGIADNTYVVYMSDHGAGARLSSNAPLRQGKGSLWEGGLRVPLIVSGPGVKAGAFCGEPVAGWDLFPTFCELAGVGEKLPRDLDGASLKPLLASGNGHLARTSELVFHFPHYGMGARGSSGGPHSMIVGDDLKLIKFYGAKDELHLFNLDKDLGERNDLVKQLPQQAERLHKQLTDYLAAAKAGVPRVNPNFDPDAAAQAGPRGRRRPGGRGGPQRRPAERRKELADLEQALEKNDKKRVGEIIAAMKKRLDSEVGQRGRPGARSSTDRRRNVVKQLEAAHGKGDTEALRKLVAEIKQRLAAGRPGRRPSPSPRRNP